MLLNRLGCGIKSPGKQKTDQNTLCQLEVTKETYAEIYASSARRYLPSEMRAPCGCAAGNRAKLPPDVEQNKPFKQGYRQQKKAETAVPINEPY